MLRRMTIALLLLSALTTLGGTASAGGWRNPLRSRAERLAQPHIDTANARLKVGDIEGAAASTLKAKKILATTPTFFGTNFKIRLNSPRAEQVPAAMKRMEIKEAEARP